MNDALNGAGALKPADGVEQSLYEIRRKIHPRAVSGRFAAWRWALVWITQLVYYGVPWLTWNDRQAVLFDLAARKFHIFGIVFWPQDFIYLTILLVISALSLFLFTAVAGRLWCGFACPQTVYTEIFLWIERMVEGDRSERMRLDAEPLGARKFALKSLKHLVWGAVALWTGFTFVGYFTPIGELWGEAVTLTLGPWETFWILFYGFATYGNAGWMREQVCKFMCPYARFQSAMFDPDTLIITYDRARGEPRGGRARSVDRRAARLGDCVDCSICVQVCPTGIDIRDGLQYECIGCAACIDGCNQVMDRMGYPRGLIRYATENELRGGWSRGRMLRRVLRARVLVYGAILAAIVVATGISLYLRVPVDVHAIRDRASLSRVVEGGFIENVYQLQVMNSDEAAHRFRMSARGLPGLHVAGDAVIDAAPATTTTVPIRLRVEGGRAAAGTHKIEIHLRALENERIAAHERTVFLVP